MMKKISALEVKKLRELTGASVMECREALEQAGGDTKKAVEHLRHKGKEKAGKKSGRKTGEGIVAAYIHSNKKIGALVELRCETDFVAKNSQFQELAYNLAMQVAALGPRYISSDVVPSQEREEYEHLVREELAAEKKPDSVIEKIVTGKVRKHFAELSLLEQAFVKNPEITVDELIKENILKIGENIQIVNFVRFEI